MLVRSLLNEYIDNNTHCIVLGYTVGILPFNNTFEYIIARIIYDLVLMFKVFVYSIN